MAAKKPASSKKPVSTPVSKKPVKSPVRNSAIPKIAKAVKMAEPAIITQDMIAVRAYEIAMSGRGGSEQDNWFQAERELRGV